MHCTRTDMKALHLNCDHSISQRSLHPRPRNPNTLSTPNAPFHHHLRIAPAPANPAAAPFLIFHFTVLPPPGTRTHTYPDTPAPISTPDPSIDHLPR